MMIINDAYIAIRLNFGRRDAKRRRRPQNDTSDAEAYRV
jgi:hypothetical protein